MKQFISEDCLSSACQHIFSHHIRCFSTRHITQNHQKSPKLRFIWIQSATSWFFLVGYVRANEDHLSVYLLYVLCLVVIALGCNLFFWLIKFFAMSKKILLLRTLTIYLKRFSWILGSDANMSNLTSHSIEKKTHHFIPTRLGS